MFGAILTSTAGLRSNQEKQDTILVKRFAFIVGTDFLCWFPIIIIKILALAGKFNIFLLCNDNKNNFLLSYIKSKKINSS